MRRLTRQHRREAIVVFTSLMFASRFVSLSAFHPTRPHDIPFGLVSNPSVAEVGEGLSSVSHGGGDEGH